MIRIGGMKLSDIEFWKQLMFYEKFHAAFDQFEKDLLRYLEQDSRTWVRHAEECYDHKRVREISVWFSPSHGQEFGYIFLAHASNWDGQIDWDRIKEILSEENFNFAIGPAEETKVWDLARLTTQKQPEPRCSICGKIISF